MSENLKKYLDPYETKLTLCLFFLGIFGLTATYYLGHSGEFHNGFFWVSILIISTSTFLIISNQKISENTKLMFLFLYGIGIYLPSFLWSPNFFHFNDEMMQARIAELIYEHGSVEIGRSVTLAIDIIRFYPGLAFLMVFLRNISELPIFYAAKFTVAIVHSLLLVFVYLFFKRISTPQISFLGAFIFTTNINYTFFNSLFAYESIGLPLFILSLLVATKLKKSINWIILATIIIGSLIIVHHFSSYMLLSILFLIMIVLRENEKIKKLFILSTVLVVSYITYMAVVTIEYFQEPIKQLIGRILEFQILEEESTKLYAIEIIPTPQYEYIISKYIYIPIILLLFTLGTYLLYKKQSKYPFFNDPKKRSLIQALIIFSLLAFFLSVLIMRGFTRIGRVLTFGYLGVSLISAIAMSSILNGDIIKQKKGAIALILILLLVVGSISIGNKMPYRIPKSLVGITASGDSTTTIDVFYAADWFREKMGVYQSIFGDKTVGTVFGNYGSQFVDDGADASILFSSNSINTSILKKKLYKNNLVIDRRISKLMPERENYFWAKPGENSSRPLPENALAKFDQNQLFSKLYANGNIEIYNIKTKNLY